MAFKSKLFIKPNLFADFVCLVDQPNCESPMTPSQNHTVILFHPDRNGIHHQRSPKTPSIIINEPLSANSFHSPFAFPAPISANGDVQSFSFPANLVFSPTGSSESIPNNSPVSPSSNRFHIADISKPLNLPNSLTFGNLQPVDIVIRILSTLLYPAAYHPERGRQKLPSVNASDPRRKYNSSRSKTEKSPITIRSAAHFSQMRRWYKVLTIPCVHANRRDECSYGSLCWYLHEDDVNLSQVLLESPQRPPTRRLSVFMSMSD
ncbi:hypothetical protein BLNAU_20737 [Blattamonas nauphoetae]|uniref:C3H1-type domain-containing protein n=1 Tax=Blattamonas nauphoetae TaxID=2049346 RepID=A0ABQ9WYF0_9EUKA|nr:hypothetical protein BLNAU_20737 [Blattamonas nauphoetae]